MAENKPTNRERLREITDGIEQGIKELFESEKYMRYLSVMSRFHRYSVNNTMPFVLLHFHKEKGPAGTLHRVSSGSLPQNGSAVLPPVSWENGRLPIFSADSSNRTVRGNSSLTSPQKKRRRNWHRTLA